MKIIILQHLIVWSYLVVVGCINAATQNDRHLIFERHVQSLNELTERRRTSRLFNNEQTPFYGQTIGYTNVGKGNTTLAMRDLVLIHRLPIIFTRVYDSSRVEASDFGVGWRLSFNEQLVTLDNGDLIYFDDTGSEHLLPLGEGESFGFSEVKNITRFDDQVTVKFETGISKTFLLIDDVYRLQQIKDLDGATVDIHYEDQQIIQVSNNYHQFIDILRNEQGFISQITDHHGRRLTYRYKDNLLISVQDLAGNYWRYRYLNRQLYKIKDPENNLVAKFTYYQDEHRGKTKRAIIARQSYRFRYDDNFTSVIDNLNRDIQFEQNPQGLTVAVINHRGETTRIEVDEQHQVKGLKKNKLVIAKFDSDQKIKPANVTNGEKIYQYDEKGLLTLIKQGSDKAVLEYNDYGRISKITFPDGSSHGYQYNLLGFRSQTIRSDGSQIDYRYDKAGNLLMLEQTQNNGERLFKEMNIDAHNLTTGYLVNGNMMLDIEYDRRGNPTRIAYNGAPVIYQYDDYNRLTTIIDGKQILNYQYQTGEEDFRIQQDERSFITRLSQGRTSHNALNVKQLYTNTVGTPLRFVYYDPNLAEFKRLALQQVVTNKIDQDAIQRRRLYNALATNKLEQRDFDKPSNSFFKAPDYDETNCEAEFCWELVEVLLSGPSSASIGQTTRFIANAIVGDVQDPFGECEVNYRFSVNGNIVSYNTSGIFDYTFNTTGPQNVEVRANCKNCARVNWQYDDVDLAIVCPESGCIEISSETVYSSTLADSRKVLGVGEVVELYSTVDGSWEIISGGGMLEFRDGVETRYKAGDVAAIAKIKFTANGQSKITEFDVIEPTAIIMRRQPNTNLNHQYGYPSIGWKAEIYLAPDTVVFHSLHTFEPFDPTIALMTTGYFDYQKGDIHYPVGSCCANGMIIEATSTVKAYYGTKLAGLDLIQGVGGPSYYSTGTATWHIPWHYYVNYGSGLTYSLATLNQTKTINRWGDMTLSKGGHTESVRLIDPTSSW